MTTVSDNGVVVTGAGSFFYLGRWDDGGSDVGPVPGAGVRYLRDTACGYILCFLVLHLERDIRAGNLHVVLERAARASMSMRVIPTPAADSTIARDPDHGRPFFPNDGWRLPR